MRSATWYDLLASIALWVGLVLMGKALGFSDPIAAATFALVVNTHARTWNWKEWGAR